MYQAPPQQQQQQQQQSRPARVEDSKRVQRVVDELNAKYTERKSGPAQPAVLDERAQQMFIDYANELTISVLEASSLLAQHRGSKTIDVEDVAMILNKKLGVMLPGYGGSRQPVAPDRGAEEAGAPGPKTS